jgi:aspartate-semialdehyde dehydrogenase
MHIGVVGATGMVGRKIIEILQEKHIQFDSLTLFASARSAGQEVIVNGQAYTIVELNETNIQKAQCDYVLMSAGGEVSKTYAPIFVQNHGIVIDNSNA